MVDNFYLFGCIIGKVYCFWPVCGRNGFRKDKGGEKLDETEENLLEHRTDGTDAFDTLHVGAEKFLHRELYSIAASGVM